MDAEFEILDGIEHQDLLVGDHVIAHLRLLNGNTVYSDCLDAGFIITEVNVQGVGKYDVDVYWGTWGVGRSTWGGQNYLHRVIRAVKYPRVQCVKCGKSLHPLLSPQAGVTHGC